MKEAKHDVICRIINNLAMRANERLGKNRKHTHFELIGCDSETLRQHLQDHFLLGMTFKLSKLGDRPRKPVASFDLTDEKQVLECFNYKNLRPLWADDNRAKSDKLDISVYKKNICFYYPDELDSDSD